MTAKQLAEHILLLHTEDIEYQSVAEMVWDSLEEDDGTVEMTQEEYDQLCERVYELVQAAEVRVMFK